MHSVEPHHLVAADSQNGSILMSPFDALLQHYDRLPDTIDTCETPEDLRRQYRALFDSPESRTARRVVYVFICERPIPRAHGSSHVAYIGKTNHSLTDRNRGTAREVSTDHARYSGLIAAYGSMRVLFRVVEDPRAEERQLLQRYQEAHIDSPPLNSRASG